MKKLILVFVAIVFALNLAQAQINFAQCEGENSLSHWVIMLHVATTDKTAYSPDDTLSMCYSCTSVGIVLIRYLFVREVNLEIWQDNIQVWSNAPPSDSLYAHEVLLGFNQVVGLDTTLDLMQFGDGEFEFKASLLCEPPHNVQLTLPFEVIDSSVTFIETQDIPDKFALFQNYPNPFNPVTKISFVLKQMEYVDLAVYNVLGKEVAKLYSQTLPAGEYNVEFNGENLPSGSYYYRIIVSGKVVTKKMVLLK